MARRKISFVVFIVVFLAVTVGAAWAVVGTVDVDNQFPYVVQVTTVWQDGEGALCSGAISGHILSTAAHCIYNNDAGPSHGWAKKVSVSYFDPSGEAHTALGRRLYVTQEWRRFADSGDHYSFTIAPHDIAYVVLDTETLTSGYIHWGVELLRNLPDGSSTCAEPECEDWTLIGERREGFLNNIQQEFGDLKTVEMVVVGCGNFICEDYSKREANCHSDGRRRYVKLPLLSHIAQTSPPWIWCTGQSGMDINPIQHGDSGGAVLAKARDGRWVFVGYTSGGDAYNGCASSMFNNLNLWRDAIAAYDEGKLQGQPAAPSQDEQLAWYRTVAKQFLQEWIAGETAEKSIALRRYENPESQARRRFWADAETHYFGQTITNEALYEQKLAFFDKWPERKFRVTQYSIQCFNVSDTCSVAFGLDWNLANPQTNSTLNGHSQLTLTLQMPMTDSKSISLGNFVPTLVSIDGDPYDGSPSTPKRPSFVVKSVKRQVSDGYLNMRSAPGLNAAIVTEVPAGAGGVTVTGVCTKSADGRSRYPWCPVNWNGYRGWVSANGLE